MMPTLTGGLVLMLAGTGFWWLMMASPLMVRLPFDHRQFARPGRPAALVPASARARGVTPTSVAALAVAVGITLWDIRSGGAPYAVMFVGWLGALALRQAQRYFKLEDDEQASGVQYVLNPDVWLVPWG
ncbi:MAG: hypothetical protein IT307_18955 [Chloroflexi bacterium]|nr:hypothetical protein [Chloroflexota bacterium]